MGLLDVVVQEMVPQNVVMVCNGDETYETCPEDCNAPVNVQMVKLLTVMNLVSAGLRHGLAMDTVMELHNNMVLIFAAMIMMVETVLLKSVLQEETLLMLVQLRTQVMLRK